MLCGHPLSGAMCCRDTATRDGEEVTTASSLSGADSHSVVGLDITT